jgi:hypothetical protein
VNFMGQCDWLRSPSNFIPTNYFVRSELCFSHPKEASPTTTTTKSMDTNHVGAWESLAIDNDVVPVHTREWHSNRLEILDHSNESDTQLIFMGQNLSV